MPVLLVTEEGLMAEQGPLLASHTEQSPWVVVQVVQEEEQEVSPVHSFIWTSSPLSRLLMVPVAAAMAETVGQL